jgi:signal peptidase I
MRAYDGIKAERGREVNLETPDFLEHTRQLLARSIPVQIRMSGSSMSPALEDGDTITVEPIPDSNIKAGDIVLYQSRYDTAVIHRVVRIDRSSTERMIVTRGDATSQNDIAIPEHRVLGRVKLIDRAGVSIKMEAPKRRIGAMLLGWLDRLRFWSRRY